jgi:hypothetical protein
MQSSSTDPKRKLEAALASARATVSILEAELESIETQPAHDELLDAKSSLARFGLGPEALRAAAERGELKVSRGARGKLLVLESELRRYIASRPYKPTPRRTQPPENLDAWEREADLRLVGGRK